MGLIQEMEKECECTEVIFQDYIQSRSSYNIFLFFEGKDDYKYYWCRISPYVGTQEYKKYVCNCKENVVSIQKMLNTKVKRKEYEKILYFADKDFEKENTLSSDIYVTPTYSIENFYISDRAIKNMIIGEFGLSSEMEEVDKTDFNIAINYLISKRDEVIESMIYANAWYSLQYNKTKNSTKFPKLSAIKEFNTIYNIKDKDYLQNLVTDSVNIIDEDLDKEIEYLKENPVDRLRGKYFEQTMPKYIMKVFQDSNKKCNRELFLKRRRININVGTDNMISVLSNYADVPNDLIAYIRSRFQENC